MNKGGIFDVEHIVSEAEALMYADKQEYYRKNAIASDRIYPLAMHE